MAGYCGYRMSNNAVAAYERGEKPISKWTKKEIIRAIYDNCDITETKMELLKKMYRKELIFNFLLMTDYHHTGIIYKRQAVDKAGEGGYIL